MPGGESERKTGALRLAAAPMEVRYRESFDSLFRTILNGLQGNVIEDALGIFELVCTGDSWRGRRERKIRSALESYLQSPEEAQFRRLQRELMVFGLEALLHEPEGGDEN